MHDLRHLNSFVAVMECGSFTAAAGARGLTVAAISRAIAQLEADLSVQLFRRTTRQIVATEQGRIFYERVRAALALLDDADDAARSVTQAVGGALRIATPNAFGRHYLLPRLEEFHATYPDVTVELHFDDYAGNIIERGFDLVIQHGTPRDLGFVGRKLMRMPIVLAASPAYLARRGVPRRPEDLYQHECIVVRFGSGRAFHWDLKPIAGSEGEDSGAGGIVRPDGSVHISNSLDANLFAALGNLGIASVDAASALDHFAAGRLKLVLPGFELSDGRNSTTVYLLYQQRKFMPARLRLFIDFITNLAAEAESAAPSLTRFAAT